MPKLSTIIVKLSGDLESIIELGILISKFYTGGGCLPVAGHGCMAEFHPSLGNFARAGRYAEISIAYRDLIYRDPAADNRWSPP